MLSSKVNGAIDLECHIEIILTMRNAAKLRTVIRQLKFYVTTHGRI